jgi:hypothetical protein
LDFLTVLEIPALCLQTDIFVFLQIYQLDNFQTFRIRASYVQIVVKFEQSFADYLFYPWRGTSIGTFIIGRIFIDPIGDAYFTEHFAALMALPRLFNNLTTYDTFEIL